MSFKQGRLGGFRNPHGLFCVSSVHCRLVYICPMFCGAKVGCEMQLVCMLSACVWRDVALARQEPTTWTVTMCERTSRLSETQVVGHAWKQVVKGSRTISERTVESAWRFPHDVLRCRTLFGRRLPCVWSGERVRRLLHCHEA